MNPTPAFTRMALAGAAVLIFAATASFAAAPTYSDLDKSLTDQLTALKVPTDALGQMTTSEVAILAATLDGKGHKPMQKAMAHYLIDMAQHPSTVDLNSADGKKLVADLTAKLSSLNLTYPSQPLTATQVQALLDLLDAAPKKAKHEARAVGAVLASITSPMPAGGTSDVLAMEADLDAKVTALGLTAPAPGTMTFDQLGQLDTIFAATGTAPAAQKTAVMKALNLS